MQTAQYLEAKELNTDRNKRAVLRILEGSRGWITDERIAEMMGHEASFERTVRLIIRDLRKEGQPIVSESGRGYKWPETREEVERTIAELRSRVADMSETARAMERTMERLFPQENQERMFA